MADPAKTTLVRVRLTVEFFAEIHDDDPEHVRFFVEDHNCASNWIRDLQTMDANFGCLCNLIGKDGGAKVVQAGGEHRHMGNRVLVGDCPKGHRLIYQEGCEVWCHECDEGVAELKS